MRCVESSPPAQHPHEVYVFETGHGSFDVDEASPSGHDDPRLPRPSCSSATVVAVGALTPTDNRRRPGAPFLREPRGMLHLSRDPRHALGKTQLGDPHAPSRLLRRPCKRVGFGDSFGHGLRPLCESAAIRRPPSGRSRTPFSQPRSVRRTACASGPMSRPSPSGAALYGATVLSASRSKVAAAMTSTGSSESYGAGSRRAALPPSCRQRAPSPRGPSEFDENAELVLPPWRHPQRERRAARRLRAVARASRASLQQEAGVGGQGRATPSVDACARCAGAESVVHEEILPSPPDVLPTPGRSSSRLDRSACSRGRRAARQG